MMMYVSPSSSIKVEYSLIGLQEHNLLLYVVPLPSRLHLTSVVEILSLLPRNELTFSSLHDGTV